MYIIEEFEAEEMYRAMLDESHPAVFDIAPSRILEECDETAYRCGFADYVDMLSEDNTLVRGWTADEDEDEDEDDD